MKYQYTERLAIFIGVFMMPLFVQASVLYFEQEYVGEGESVVTVKIDADKPVNAFSGKVLFPSDVVPAKVNTGGSITNFWVDNPAYDTRTQSVSFSGIVPGGFFGDGNILFSFTLPARVNGELTFDTKETTVLLHTESLTPDTVELLSLPLAIKSDIQQEKPRETLVDTTPPESFTPIISNDLEIFDGKNFVVFSTQDKESGEVRYFVAESTQHVKNVHSLPWVEAVSPHVLSDQTLSSYVYIRAVDASNNERVEVVLPSNPQAVYKEQMIWGIILITAFSTLWYFIARRSRREKTSSHN